MKEEIKDLVAWLQDKVKEAGAKGVVFGLSGGVDSSVVAAVSKLAFGEDALGIIMPCESNPKDEEDARLVAEAIDLNIEKVDLTNTFKYYLKDSFISDNLMAKSNIKPRLRMLTLYYYAQDRNYLVLGCSNASEFYLGYYTKYGDSGADLIPLAEFLKDEVYDLAKELNIPSAIIEKAPSAGLFEDQSDEKEMGFTYKDLNDYIRGKKIDDSIARKIEKMHKNSEHKRKFAPIYKRRIK
ncbi:NAD(+) synthase [Peptoniphilus catoniae]|uniref:NAD(+) synthase n=1 Tax=Peptoniphilus catoniae TaxID=1660341 RepID=UPI0010FF2221|nr:NAD(+) synthase [Peptoniphilus catoniae]